MTTTFKIILAFSVGAFAFSFTDVGGHFLYGIIRPIAAVAFIVFFLGNMLCNEMRNFDEDPSRG